MIKAASMAMEKVPIINSRINKDLTEVTLLASHNIAIAVATPQGNFSRELSLRDNRITRPKY